VLSRVDLFFQDLGPGLITGCADDDPSGIASYAIARRGVRLCDELRYLLEKVHPDPFPSGFVSETIQ